MDLKIDSEVDAPASAGRVCVVRTTATQEEVGRPRTLQRRLDARAPIEDAASFADTRHERSRGQE